MEQREVGAPKAKRLVSLSSSEQVWKINTCPKECKKAEDEGNFTIITTIGIANVEFIIVVGGMDFRAMLLKTTVEQKILVLTRIGWIRSSPLLALVLVWLSSPQRKTIIVEKCRRRGAIVDVD